MTRRERAERTVRSVAETNDSFRIRDVIENSETLDESNRDTVSRVLHSFADQGLVEQRTSGSPIWLSTVDTNPGTEPSTSPNYQQGPIRILHGFADHGVEAEALVAYGEVIRVGLDPRDTNRSQPVKADCNQLPFEEGAFDLGVFHPECARFSPVTSISGNPEDHPNQIPLAREIGRRYCDHYIIENRPEAAKDNDGLQTPPDGSMFTLDGRQFGLPLRFERAFETSFPVHRRPYQQPLRQEISPYFSADRSTEYWRALKGYSGPYTKSALARNAVPRSFVDFIMREYWHHVGETDSKPARSQHTDPDPNEVSGDD